MDEQGRDSDRDSNSPWLRGEHDRLTEKSGALALKLKEPHVQDARA